MEDDEKKINELAKKSKHVVDNIETTINDKGEQGLSSITKIAHKSKDAIDDIEKSATELSNKVKELKKRYKDIDAKKKKKIMKLISAVLAIIGTIICIKMLKKKININEK